MPLVGALVIKEFQTWLRGRFTFAIFSALVVFVSALVFLFGFFILAPDANAAPALFSTSGTTSSNVLVTNRPFFLFGAVGACLLLAAGAVAPAVAGSAFASERERGTLDLLLLQGTGSLRLVLSKVLAAWLFSLLILLVGVPLFAPVWSFGGVRPEHLGIMALTLAASTLLYSALGVFFGAVVPRALPAALFGQAVALFLLIGSVALYGSVAAISGNEVLKPLLWLNPFLAMLSGGGASTDALARLAPHALRGLISLPASTPLPGVSLPAWAVASLWWGAISTALIVAASVAVDPCHTWKARRAREAGLSR